MNQSAWNDSNLEHPHAVADKARRVEAMFAAIAPRYDLNNRLHSLGRDQAWRRAAVRMAEVKSGDIILDVACGTGDLTLQFTRTKASRVIGVDFTFNMLGLARKKLGRKAGGNWACLAGDAMRLPLASASVDVVSIAFGIRNVVDPAAAMAEFYRVLRPGGRVIVLEFSMPRGKLLRKIYTFYFNHILPRTAALIAGDRSGAYRYLPQSVQTFMDRLDMLDLMRHAGFVQTTLMPLTFGIAMVYRGIKTP